MKNIFMPLNKIIFCLLLGTLSFLGLTSLKSQAYAEDARIFLPQPFNLSWQGDTFTFAARPKIDQTEHIKSFLRDGTTIALNISLKLERIRSVLPSVELANTNTNWLLKYENLTKEYIVSQDYTIMHRNKNFDSFISTAWNEATIQFLTSELADPDNEYLLTTNVSLKHTEIPPWIKKNMIYWYFDIATATQLSVYFKVDATGEILILK